MTKKQMIDYLIREWIGNSQNQDIRKCRFINSETVRVKLDRNWVKDGIVWAYDLYVCEGWDIDRVIEKFYELKF